MVKRRIIGLSILPILLLSSCKQKILRSDIADFIASFSLESSIEEYKEAGYTRVQEIIESGVKTTIREEMSFNVKNLPEISYLYTYSKVVDNESVEEKFTRVSTENEKYFYETEEANKRECTLEEADQELIKFFYEYNEYDFHKFGCYYGDIVKESAYSFQNYTTIDEENHLYKLNLDYFDQSINANYKQSLIVNSLGMLVENNFEIVSNENKSSTIWTVYKN